MAAVSGSQGYSVEAVPEAPAARTSSKESPAAKSKLAAAVTSSVGDGNSSAGALLKQDSKSLERESSIPRNGSKMQRRPSLGRKSSNPNIGDSNDESARPSSAGRRPSKGAPTASAGMDRQTSTATQEDSPLKTGERRPSLTGRRPSLTRRNSNGSMHSVGTTMAGGGRRKYLMKKGSRDNLGVSG